VNDGFNNVLFALSLSYTRMVRVQKSIAPTGIALVNINNNGVVHVCYGVSFPRIVT
jgi:hypothetical protein